MSGALTQAQLQWFEQQISELLEQLQQEEQELLARVQDADNIAAAEDGCTVMEADLTMQIAACREALVRIEAGSYGYCDSCGELIELNHLKADPAVCRCVRCQRQQR